MFACWCWWLVLCLCSVLIDPCVLMHPVEVPTFVDEGRGDHAEVPQKSLGDLISVHSCLAGRRRRQRSECLRVGWRCSILDRYVDTTHGEAISYRLEKYRQFNIFDVTPSSIILAMLARPACSQSHTWRITYLNHRSTTSLLLWHKAFDTSNHESERPPVWMDGVSSVHVGCWTKNTVWSRLHPRW